MDKTPSRASTPRSVSLDILRILAALWVVLFHWGGGVYGTSSLPDALKLGYLGVDVFFILSGAVIIHTALDRSWSDFARRRFLRLFPVFFVVTVATVVWVLVKGQRDFDPLLAIEPSGLGMWQGQTPIVPVAWTLFYEVNFYILVAILIRLRGRLDERAARGGIQVFLLGCLIAPLVNEPLLNIATLQPFGPLFALGAIAGITISAGGLRRNLPTILVAGFLSFTVALDRISPTIENPVSQALWTVGLLLVSGGFLLWDKFFRTRPDARRRLKASITTLSLMTYPVYLVHQEFGVRLVNFMVVRGADPVLAYAVSGVCLLLITWLGVKYFEPWARSGLRRLFAWDPA